MNLLENEEQVARSKKTKVIMAVIIVTIVVLICVCIGIVYMMSTIKEEMLKVSIDGKAKAGLSSDLFVFEEDEVYVSIKDFATLVGYSAVIGDHKTNDPTKCYIENMYEEAAFELNSTKIYKTLKTGTDNEYYVLSQPVKMINNKLYVNLEGMKIGSNTSITYNKANNQIIIYTLDYLTTYYTGKVNNAVIIGKNVDFSNQKAVLYNLVVTANENEKYGLYNTADGKVVFEPKYLNMKFLESSQEFLVTTDDKKMGIIGSDGKTKIEAKYDEIKQIDKDSNLYLVTNNKKQGVITQNGATVVFLEFDKIGVQSSQFPNDEIKNQYLLYDTCIPVQRDKKWGIYDKTGKLVVPVEYDTLGCAQSNRSALLIPEYKGIVIQKEKKYGLVNSSGETLIPCVLDSFSTLIIDGQNSYQMMQGEKQLDVIKYLEEYVVKPESPIVNSIANDTDINSEAAQTNGTATNTDVSNEEMTNGTTNNQQ